MESSLQCNSIRTDVVLLKPDAQMAHVLHFRTFIRFLPEEIEDLGLFVPHTSDILAG